MNRIIIALLIVSIILINIPMFKNKKTNIVIKKTTEIPKIVIKKPLEYPKNYPRVNMYRSEQTEYDFV